MKRKIILAILGLFLFGCNQRSPEKIAPAATKEEAVLNVASDATTQAQPQQTTDVVRVPEVITEPVVIDAKAAQKSEELTQPPEKEIQQALKNAGLYEGEIDGKIGPKSKKAIEEFQAKNSLKVDGKVGANTWKRLKEYLSASPVSASQSSKN